MRRLLIISPRFPPKNTPDEHRVRTSLPYFEKYGWDPTVLCLTPETTDGVDDPMLLKSVLSGTRLVRVPAWRESICRKFGFGHLDYRCLLPLYQAGCRLLSSEQFDLIYFSTTAFLTFVLGPRWKRIYGSKVVYDFQDPWYTGTNSIYDPTNAPGGWFKYQVSQMISSQAEPYALRAADHVISVSEGYIRDLSSRYSWLSPEKFSVIPFGAASLDHEILRRAGIQQHIFEKNGKYLRWVYVGRGGPDINPVLSVFFQQLARLKQSMPDLKDHLRVYFVGTNYSPAHRTFKVVEPLASQYGLSDIVIEHSERIPYFEALSLIRDSDAVLLVGSVSADYVASKLFNCVLSKKPVLALFHARSMVSQIAPMFGNIFLASFQSAPDELTFCETVARGLNWLIKGTIDDKDFTSILHPFTAEYLAARQCAIFDRLFQV